MFARLPRAAWRLAVLLFSSAAALAAQEVRETFDTAEPPGWVLEGARSGNGVLTLRSSSKAIAPLEWQDFELSLVTPLTGLLDVRYGGVCLRIERGALSFLEEAPRGRGRASDRLTFDPAGATTEVRLIVRGGEHVAEISGGAESLRLAGRPIPPSQIALGSVENQIARVDEVRIRALPVEVDLALRKVVPGDVERGGETSLFLVGDGFEQGMGVTVAPGSGLEVRAPIFHGSQLVELPVHVFDEAPPTKHSVTVSLGRNRRAELLDAFQIVDAPPPPPVPEPRTPEVHRLEPSFVVQGGRAEVTLVGHDIGKIVSIRRATPDTDVEVGPLTHTGADRSTFVIRAAPWARPGPVALTATFADPDLAPVELGFTILAAPALPEVAAPGPTTAWLVGTGIVAFLAGLFGGFPSGWILGRISRFPWRRAQEMWQAKAKLELPGNAGACAWGCRAEASAGLADWEVTALRVTPLPADGEGEAIDGPVLGPLNDHARLRGLFDDESEVRDELAPIAEAFVGKVAAWTDDGRSPAAVHVAFSPRKPVETTFVLQHRESRNGVLQWVEKRRWKRKVRAGKDEPLAVLRGPDAGEERPAERMREEFLDVLLELARRVRVKP